MPSLTGNVRDAVDRPWLGLVVVYGCLMSFGCVFQFVPPLVPVLLLDLGLDHGRAGLLMSLFALPGILLSIPAGSLVDRFGVRSVGGLGLGLMAAGTAGMALPGTFALLLLARAVGGMGAMVAVVALQRTVTRLFAGRPLGLPMGIVSTAIPIGIVLALNGASPIATAHGWRAVAVCAGVLAGLTCVAFLIMCTRLTVTGESVARSVPVAGPAPSGAVSFRAIWMAGLVWLCANGAMTAFVTFAPDHYLDLGLGAGARGLLASLPMWLAAGLGPVVGWVTDRRGGKGAFIATGMLVMAFFLAALPGAVFAPLVIGLGLGVAMGCVPTPLLSLPVDVVPSARHGRAFGILSACANTGIFLVPPLAGALRDATGAYLWPFLLMAAVAALGMVAALRLPVGNLRRGPAWAYVLLLPLLVLVLHIGLARPRTDTRNLLLITLDTTRADQLGAYGGRRVSTPNLDLLAADGTLFTQAITPVPTTLASHTTMMTGLTPREHGVARNGFALGDSLPLLAEILAASGYRTAAFISSFALDPRFGLSRGFDHYDDGYDPSADGLKPWRQGFETASRAATWLSTRPEPFFVWVHLFDPHHPYSPTAAHDPVPADHPGAALYAGRQTTRHLRQNPQQPGRDELIDFLQWRYAGEIAATDAQVGLVLAALRGSGRAERTLVALLSDHGEGLSEHGEMFDHGEYLYQTTIHVPMLLHCPWRRFATRVETRVGTMDLMPTLLDLLGQQEPASQSGRSLVSMMTAGAVDDSARVFHLNATKPFHLEAGLPPEHLNQRKARGVILGDWKYVFQPEGSAGERELLFHLGNDPHEMHNLITELPELAARFQTLVQEYWAEGDSLAGGPETDAGRRAVARELVDEETRRKLRSLGYLR